MHTFQYRQGYYLHQVARMTFAAIACAAFWWHSGNWAILGTAVFVGLCALLSFHSMMMSDEPALSFDEQKVRINGLFGITEYRWQDLTGIYMQKVGSAFVMMMPIGGSMSICFQTDRMSMTFGRTWLPVAAIDLPPGGASELLETLNHTWEAATQAKRGSSGMSGQLQDELA